VEDKGGVNLEAGAIRCFGAQYEDFRANVPRWIPRLSPWRTA
jgi:hypothetical protein